MIVLDIEASGLDPEKNGLLSIGAVDFKHPKATFYGECYIRKNEQVSSGATEVNGYGPKEARDRTKLSTKQLLEGFKQWLDSRPIKVIAGLHVGAFDSRFLNTKAKQVGVGLYVHYRSIDLHSIAYAKMLELKKVIPLTDGWSVVDTDFIHPFCGLPLEPKPHNALSGAKWEAESLSRLIYGRNLLPEFKEFAVPNLLIKNK